MGARVALFMIANGHRREHHGYDAPPLCSQTAGFANATGAHGDRGNREEPIGQWRIAPIHQPTTTIRNGKMTVTAK